MFSAIPYRNWRLLTLGTIALAAVAVALFFLLSSPVHAATLSVDKDDAGCDDETGTPYCTIQAALDDAADGDTLEVQAATTDYVENVDIGTVDVTLQGVGTPTAPSTMWTPWATGGAPTTRTKWRPIPMAK